VPPTTTSIASRGAGLLSRLLPGERVTFATGYPSAQAAVDAAPASWASRLPAPLQDVRAGDAALFDDPRMVWAFESFGGLDGMSVVELGPLEGGHSYMARQAGASQVTAVEANPRAFLKCLIVKELLSLDGVSFLCGDALEYLDQGGEQFDLCVACGILYHMVEPARLIDLISRRAKRLVMWTHIYDRDAVAQTRPLQKRLGPEITLSHNGYSYRAHRYSYGADHSLGGFCGGTQPHAHWLPREELFRTLEHFGWGDIEVAFDERTPNGPALILVATRQE
jgi:hypothetical protein